MERPPPYYILLFIRGVVVITVGQLICISVGLLAGADVMAGVAV